MRTIRLGIKTVAAWGSLLSGTAVLLTAWTAAAAEAPPPAANALGTIHPELWPAMPPAIAVDPALETRISTLLATMTLEQKVGQMIQADIGSITPDDLRHYPLGSILNGGSSSPGNDEFAPPSEWLALADRFYDAAMDASHGAHPIPTMWGTDAVHGHNNLVGATIFPHNIGLGAARDPELIRRIGAATAVEVRATGIDWTFGPTLAVVRDDRWGRTYESYSEDPEIVRAYAGEMVLGLQGVPGSKEFLDSSHVIATAKHFVGDGGTGGRDQGDNRASETELRDIHFAGYPPAISAGVQSVMASFSSWQGVKLHGARGLLTDVLKGRLQFDGLVIGDWNGHGQVPSCSTVSCAAAFNAGLDIIMAPDSWKGLYLNTVAQAKSGEIPAARIDDAVRRILRVKLRAHLFEESRPSSRPLAGHFDLLGSPEHRAIARQGVRESLVLIKNENHLLPLAPLRHVLVAGEGADSIGKQSGGWTITWQGTGVTNKDFPHGETIFSGIHSAVTAAGGTAELSAAGTFKTRPDVAIVVFGEDPYAEFQGDIGSVEFSPGDKHDLKLLRGLRAQGIPVVALFLSGRPLWVNGEINASNAFVAAWLPGTEGGGVADVLFKAQDGSVPYDFHGKLSFSWPRTAQQTAVNRGDGGEPPLFAYGYGLRYADDGNLKKLPEALGAANSSIVDPRVFFSAGRPGAGWHWMVTEPGQSREMQSGVGVTSSGRARMSAIDRVVQEDSRQIQLNGSGPVSVGLVAKTPMDLRRDSNSLVSLGFDFKVDVAPTADVSVEIACGAGCKGEVPVTKRMAGVPRGQWLRARLPLTCFSKAGADLSRVTEPFAIASTGALTVSVANIRLDSSTDAMMSCDE